MLLLQDLGFGLDLSECAATGTDADLIYVSPKSGRAVSRDAGKPYCDRLLKLPRFLLEDDASPTPADVLAGFALTGHFFERDVLSPHGLALPASRHASSNCSHASILTLRRRFRAVSKGEAQICGPHASRRRLRRLLSMRD